MGTNWPILLCRLCRAQSNEKEQYNTSKLVLKQSSSLHSPDVVENGIIGLYVLGHANYPPLTTQTCALCRLFCVLFLCLCFPSVACTVIGGEE